MSFLDVLTGNAAETAPKTADETYATILAEGETIEKFYNLLRDSFLFTNRRLILVDKQGITGKKVEYHTYPYKSITHFSVETAGGFFDLDAELKIWISGNPTPVSKRFNRSVNIYELQSVLATYVLKS
jgi:hypothetical protein